MKKRRTEMKIARCLVFLLVLVLTLLTVYKPAVIEAVLQVLGKGIGKMRLTAAAESFQTGMDLVIRGILQPEGEYLSIMTIVKAVGVDIAGIIATQVLGSFISDKMYISYGAGVLYAYLPCTAAVFLVNGVGISNNYLLISLIVLCFTLLFGSRK